MSKLALSVYNLAWGIVLPLLRRNVRLADGFDERTLKTRLPKADIWIQAASAGESYLARTLLETLKPVRPIQALITTNTRQGFDILQQAAMDLNGKNHIVRVLSAYFPFDRPAIMEKAVAQVRPKLMITLESEIWPGLFAELKKTGVRTLILNGRMTEKSLRRYRWYPGLWRSLSPDRVLAISRADANRFASLFGDERVQVMPNIKFDRIAISGPATDIDTPLNAIIDRGQRFLALGSIRREEESAVLNIISSVLARRKDVVIGLFPRHMERLAAWGDHLTKRGIPWTRRSEMASQASIGSIILWDVFGELSAAYNMAQAAFIGGSLAPLGGQNFLEPLMCGISPVIGPHWENFKWVGEEIVSTGMVREAKDWKQAADMLATSLDAPASRSQIRQAASAFLKNRQGGTLQACRLINRCLSGDRQWPTGNGRSPGIAADA
mgnify:CR=1 FL=1